MKVATALADPWGDSGGTHFSRLDEYSAMLTAPLHHYTYSSQPIYWTFICLCRPLRQQSQHQNPTCHSCLKRATTGTHLTRTLFPIVLPSQTRQRHLFKQKPISIYEGPNVLIFIPTPSSTCVPASFPLTPFAPPSVNTVTRADRIHG
jgi:hypothetical protein